LLTSRSETVPRAGMRLASFAYDRLKERLLEGELAAGSRLNVEELALAFGASKQPIMEALRRLAADGLVVITPQVGCSVAAYAPSDVRDFFRVFAATEASIASLAAEHRSDEQLRRLAAVSQRIDSLRPRVDPLERGHGYRVLNREFHGLVHEMARSTVVADIAARMEDLSDFLINTTGVPQPFSAGLAARHADHETIRAALVAADADAAWAAMAQHILSTVDVIHGERG
jgi:DNA-binding GntR family transcriptional regulator